MSGEEAAQRVEQLLDTPDLAEALGNDRFKQILDQVPVGIAVAELTPAERIVYANLEFDRLTTRSPAHLIGQPWEILADITGAHDQRPLSKAVTEDSDHIGLYDLRRDDGVVRLDAWSNLIEDEEGAPAFRLVALVARASSLNEGDQDLEHTLAIKDLQLRELQHRVKNNLQMITSLIRFEARDMPDSPAGERFDRLAGRVGALALLYRSLTGEGLNETVDLGIYLSEIASGVMRAHATEGIHLDMQVDTWPVSINVAMPAGLVVNELMTNALKHAFQGRDGGTIQLHSLVDASHCRVVVADDGIGLPVGATWPTPGKMSALFVRSLLQNAKATIDVTSTPGKGVRAEIVFAPADAAPSAVA